MFWRKVFSLMMAVMLTVTLIPAGVAANQSAVTDPVPGDGGSATVSSKDDDDSGYSPEFHTEWSIDEARNVTFHTQIADVKPTEFDKGVFEFILDGETHAKVHSISTIEAEGFFEGVSPGHHQVTVNFVGEFHVSSGNVEVTQTQTYDFKVPKKEEQGKLFVGPRL